MRKTVFLLLIFNFQFSILHCQEYIWPIKKDNNSERTISVKNRELDILFRPQEYIEKEYNFGDLFLTAPEGTPVVAPVDGTIISYHYTYHSSILTSCCPGIEVTNDFNIDRRNISELVKSGRTCIKKFDEKYLSLSVGIQTANGRKVWISGLHPAKRYKTGEKIKKGEIIGTMGYSYKPIGQPSIKIVVSEKDGRWSDPMAPFGLKSTFIKYADKKIPAVLSKAEAKEDYEILIGALKEGHPGLYDYMSEQEFENHVNHTINTIPAEISIADFERLVIATVNKIRDSHTAVISPPNFKNRIAQYYPSVYFGWLNNSLIVNRVADSEKQYYGKRIVAVDSIPVDSLKEIIRPYFEKQEGFIENFGDINFLNTALKYFEYVPSASKKCDVVLQFEDGTQKFFKGYKSHGQKSGLIPDREDLLKFLMINQPADEEVIVKMLSDSVAYVGISTFSMNDVEFDQLREFMKSISNSGCPNLIIDVRNNSGGKDATKFFSYIAQEPFKAFEYTKVNKQENYEYLQYSLNYTPEIVSYSYFVPVEGKSGFYSFNDELCYPDRSINYKGKVYILTNERSYSASSDLAALIKKYYRGAVVGRETGSGFYQMNARETPQLRLPNSLIVVRYPLVKFVFISQPDERIPWGRGVLPDYPVSFTLEDFAFANGDTVLNYALHLIETGKYIEKPLTPENSVPNKPHWGIYLCIGLVIALVAVLFWVFYRKKR